MNYEAFANLELLPDILKKLDFLIDEVAYLTPDLSKRSGVAQYLKVSEKTINNHIKNNRFILNEHYYVKNSKIIFVEDKIKEFRMLYQPKKNFTVISERLKRLTQNES